MLANRSMPQCTVIPELAYRDIGEAFEWLASAFGFTLRLRIGDHRAQLNVGDGGAVVLTRQLDAGSERLSGQSLMIRVVNVDQHYEHARQYGVRILRAPADYPYGERQYTAEDPGGHCWTFSQSIADIDPEAWGGTPGQL